MTFPPANRATTPLNVKNGPSHIFFFLSQYSIHDPADIWQTSPAPWVPGRAVASAQPLFLRDLFHDKRSAIFRYIHFNIFCRKSKTITNRIIHCFSFSECDWYWYNLFSEMLICGQQDLVPIFGPWRRRAYFSPFEIFLLTFTVQKQDKLWFAFLKIDVFKYYAIDLWSGFFQVHQQSIQLLYPRNLVLYMW